MSYTKWQLKQMSRNQLIETVLSHQELIMGLASDADTIPRQQAKIAVEIAIRDTIKEGQHTLETVIIPLYRANVDIQIIIERLAAALAVGGRGELLQQYVAGLDKALVTRWMDLEKMITNVQRDNDKTYGLMSQRLADLSRLIPDLVRGIRACELGDNGDALRVVFDEWGEDDLRALLADVNEQIASIGRPPDEAREHFGDVALAVRERLYPGRPKANRDHVIRETISELEQSDHPLAESALMWWDSISHTSSGKPTSPRHCRNELSRQIANAKKRRILLNLP